jgi:hypothetical protein
LRNFNSTGILYGVIAGIDAWKNAGLSLEINEEPDWDSGTILVLELLELINFAKAFIKLMIFKPDDWVVQQ